MHNGAENVPFADRPAVIGGADDEIVKGEVGVDIRLHVDGFAALRQRLHALDLRVQLIHRQRPLFHGNAQAHRLDIAAIIIEIADILLRVLDDARRFVCLPDDKPLSVQDQERLADAGLADAERVGEIVFLQMLPRQQLAADDLLADQIRRAHGNRFFGKAVFSENL